MAVIVARRGGRSRGVGAAVGVSNVVESTNRIVFSKMVGGQQKIVRNVRAGGR